MRNTRKKGIFAGILFLLCFWLMSTGTLAAEKVSGTPGPEFVTGIWEGTYDGMENGAAAATIPWKFTLTVGEYSQYSETNNNTEKFVFPAKMVQESGSYKVSYDAVVTFWPLKRESTYNRQKIQIQAVSGTVVSNFPKTFPLHCFEGNINGPEGTFDYTNYGANIFKARNFAMTRTSKPTRVVHNVLLDANGGSVDPSFLSVAYGEEITEFPIPTRAGYEFDGWTYNGQKFTSASYFGYWDITFQATWKEKPKVKVRFDLNGTGNCSVKEMTLDVGGTYQGLPVPKRSGWTFTGWYDSRIGGTKVTDKTKVTNEKEHTLYAGWELNYVLTLNANGGKVDGKSKKAYEIAKDAKLSTVFDKVKLSRTGYTFEGWFKKKGKSTQVKASQKYSWIVPVSLYAHWKANTYTVVYNKNASDAKGTIKNSKFTYDTAAKLKKNAYTRTGYTFTGWNTKANGKGKTYKNAVSVKNLTAAAGKKITLYAQWKANTYTIVYAKNATKATGTMKSTSAVYGKSVKLRKNAFKYKDYIFDGWTLDITPLKKTYKDEATVKNLAAIDKAKIPLKAKWRKAVKVSSLKFSSATVSVATGATIDLSKYLNIVPMKADNKQVTWSSTDGKNVSVDKNGIAKGLKENSEAYIQVKAKDGSGKTAKIQVKVTNKAEALRKAIVDEAEYWWKNGNFTYSRGSWVKNLDRSKKGPYLADCSGFTRSIYYKIMGKNLSSSAGGQKAAGTNIPFERGNYKDILSKIKPGDLILIDNKKELLPGKDSGIEVGHVGIYVGNEQMIHMLEERSGKEQYKDGKAFNGNVYYNVRYNKETGKSIRYNFKNIAYIVRVISDDVDFRMTEQKPLLVS